MLFCVLSIHLPLVLLFPLWQFYYWYEIPINPFYNNSFPSNAFYLLFFLFALYASFKRCVCHSIKVTKYTC